MDACQCIHHSVIADTIEKSADRQHKHIIFEYFNSYVIIAYICYVGILALNVLIYTKIDYRFGAVSHSLALVFVMLFSTFILKERIGKRQMIGMF